MIWYICCVQGYITKCALSHGTLGNQGPKGEQGKQGDEGMSETYYYFMDIANKYIVRYKNGNIYSYKSCYLIW